MAVILYTSGYEVEVVMDMSRAGKGLAVLLVAYVVADILLTPPARLETRDPALVTPVGFVTLGLLFLGLLLAVISVVLLIRGSRRASVLAVIAAVLYFPAVIAEWSGHFSKLSPPPAIATVEVIQAFIAVLVIVFAIIEKQAHR